MIRRTAPFALLVGAIALYDRRYHEFWRDEACALLEAAAVPWTGLLHAMRLEGIPPLFHVLLKLLALALPNPTALLVAGAIGFATLLTGTYRLVDSISGSRRAALFLTLALSLTYTYAYELGVVIRQYSLGLGLAFLAAAYLRRAVDAPDPRWIRRGTLAASLSALVSVHSACVAGAALLAFGLVQLAARKPLRAFWPIFLTLPCFALVVYLGLPFSERTPEANRVIVRAAPAALRVASQLLIEGLVPNDWWRAESFVSPGLQTPFAALRSLAFWGTSLALGLATYVRAAEARRRPVSPFAFEIITATAGCVPLLVVMVYRYWGNYRHQLFLGIPAIVIAAAWLARPAAGAFARAARLTAAAALLPWLALQLWMAGIDLTADARHTFSDTKAAAAALPRGARVIGKEEWQSASLLFWRPDIHYRSPSGNGRPYRYTIPDHDWHRFARLPSLLAAECKESPKSVYFAGFRDALGALAPCATLVPFGGEPPGEHPFTWESFNLHHLDCACIAARP